MNFPALRADGPDSSVPATASKRPPMVVFSTLRWQEAWQRPQQLLTCLARHYHVFYVEPPLTTHEDAWLETSTPAPGVELVVPHTRVEAAGFHDDQIPVLQSLLAGLARRHAIVDPVVWLCTPMALPLAGGLGPRALVYDCSEDPAERPDAPRQWHQRESALLKIADLVLAGGPSLHESRRTLHANAHCLPNAVDAEHFDPTTLAGSSIEAISARSIHAALPGPRLGFFGVIDECLDLDLVDALAQERPDWQVVLAGPVLRIDAQALPRRPNLHWIGPQTHAILPHLLAHWDACILPLKCAESARQASPLPTLAYLAGQKSVISTPVHDVVALHGHIVRIASNAHAFVEACRAALTERGPLRRQRRMDALIAVHSSTWARAADRVHKLIVECAHESPTVARATVPGPATSTRAPVAHTRVAMR